MTRNSKSRQRATRPDAGEVNRALQSLTRRAERVDSETLKKTFVSIGGLEESLLNKDHKIIFGRRGTGKTHALLYLSEVISAAGDASVFLDLRVLGSGASFYSDQRVPVAERATKLLVDFVLAVHEGVYAHAASTEKLAFLAEALDELAAAAQSVTVEGTVEQEAAQTEETTRADDDSVALLASRDFMRVSFSTTEESANSSTRRFRQVGNSRLSVHFGSVSKALNRITRDLGGRLWILVDEWTAIPADLQPFLADFLRRTCFPVPAVSVAIAAIEQRAVFQLPTIGGYIGIELGADAFANINLDDFMVFENDPKKSLEFFSEIIVNHLMYSENRSVPIDRDAFAAVAFTNKAAFKEFVRSSEGFHETQSISLL